MRKLSLNKDIYSSESIEEGISAFKRLAKINHISGKKNTLVIFHKCKYEEERTIKEFENYLIQVQNRHSL